LRGTRHILHGKTFTGKRGEETGNPKKISWLSAFGYSGLPVMQNNGTEQTLTGPQVTRKKGAREISAPYLILTSIRIKILTPAGSFWEAGLGKIIFL